MRSPTSPQMKAQWSVNLSMNTPTTLSVLVPAYNEQYLVYANLGRLSSKSTQKSGSCRSTNSTLDSSEGSRVQTKGSLNTQGPTARGTG